MNPYILIFLLVSVLHVTRGASSDQEMHPTLKGLEKFLGSWKVEASDGKGGVFSVTYVAERACEGKAVSFKGKASDGGTIVAMWYFDPATKRITQNGVNYYGEVWKRTYPSGLASREFENDISFTYADGAQESAKERVKWIDDDTWTITVHSTIREGKAQPDQHMTFKRVK